MEEGDTPHSMTAGPRPKSGGWKAQGPVGVWERSRERQVCGGVWRAHTRPGRVRGAGWIGPGDDEGTRASKVPL